MWAFVYLGSWEPAAFDVNRSLNLLFMIIIGGLGSIAGAFFMPFLAATLLYLNNRREWMGALANRWLGNTALIVCLLVFGAV